MHASWVKPLVALGALALGIGCEGSPSSPEDVDPDLISPVPSSQWAGGTVEATHASFAVELPVVVAGAETLAVALVADSTVRVTLPAHTSGALVLAFHRGPLPVGQGTVEVHGLVRARLINGTLGYEPLVPESLRPVRFVAEGAASSSLTVLDPSTEQVSTVSGIGPVQVGFGILPSYQANRFVVRDSTGALGAWTLWPAPALQGSSPLPRTFPRHVTQLADTIWFTTYSNFVTVTTSAGTILSGTFVSDPLRLVRSPAGDRFALVMRDAVGGRVPVFAAATGDTAYTLPLAHVDGAAFSTTGDRMYLSARPTLFGGLDSVHSYQPGTGQRLASAPLLAGYHGSALEMDPAGTALYEVADSSGTAALLVFDPVTLALIGRLTAPGFGSSNYWSAAIAVDPSAGLIHVAYPGSPIPLATFSRRP